MAKADAGGDALEEQPLAESLMEFSNIGRTVDGAGFTYRSMACVGKRISLIKVLQPYAHLTNIDLSQNAIKDVTPLMGVQLAMKLDLSQNKIENLKGWAPAEEGEAIFPQMTHLNLSSNAFQALPSLVTIKALREVSFARNSINTCQDFAGHELIETLDLSENSISSYAGLGPLPALVKLDISSNELESLHGLSDVPALEELNVACQNQSETAKNRFEALEGPETPAPWQDLAGLHSLNVSSCQLQSVKNLEVLRQLPKLRTLGMKGNTFCETLETDARIEVLLCHWRLSSLDGEPVTQDELEQAKALSVERQLELRAAKKAEEEAAAAAAGEE